MTTQEKVNTGITIRFENGKEFNVFAQETKSGVRFYYWSPSNGRMMPISKAKVEKYRIHEVPKEEPKNNIDKK